MILPYTTSARNASKNPDSTLYLYIAKTRIMSPVLQGEMPVFQAVFPTNLKDTASNFPHKWDTAWSMGLMNSELGYYFLSRTHLGCE